MCRVYSIFFETESTTQRSTWRHVPKDTDLHEQRYKNLKCTALFSFYASCMILRMNSEFLLRWSS
jgi:hypothetical protein